MLMERVIWLEKEIHKHWSAHRSGQIEAVLKDKSLSLTKEDKEHLHNEYERSYAKEKREQARWPWNESGY